MPWKMLKKCGRNASTPHSLYRAGCLCCFLSKARKNALTTSFDKKKCFRSKGNNVSRSTPSIGTEPPQMKKKSCRCNYNNNEIVSLHTSSATKLKNCSTFDRAVVSVTSGQNEIEVASMHDLRHEKVSEYAGLA